MKKPSVKQLAQFQKLLYILAAIFTILSYFTEVKENPRPLLWVAGILLILSIVWRFVFIKCPDCGDTLANSKTIPDVCPNCGCDLTAPQSKEKK